MAFRGKTTSRLMVFGLVGAAACFGEFRFEVRHEHWRKGCRGTLVVDESGISYHGEKKHSWSWKYQDIEELKLRPEGIHLVSYHDRWLLAGADQPFDFRGNVPPGLYAFWKDRLDQRFVAEVPDSIVQAGWEIPAKLLGRVSGSEGVLKVGEDRIVYEAPKKQESRTWRFRDIDNISSSGPFQLTITTLEKGFNFQLKQVLTDARYNQLWLAINQKNGRIQ